MKKLSLLASFVLTAIFALSAALCTAQDSIQYQLVIRDAAGQLVTGKQVNMKFSLISGGQSFYEETQKTTTDKYGNISVFVGTGTAVSGSMKNVPWSTMDISMKVEADTDGGNSFKELGTVPMSAAPYAMYAATAGGNANNGSSKDDEALFEVCDRDGQPVFAVYNDGIVVYVDDSNADKVKRSGFVVTGRNTKDGESADYFSVDAEGTHVYVDDDADNTKAKRSGFVVTGRSSKGAGGSKRSTNVRTGTKASNADMFAIKGGLTTVYIDNDDNSDAPRSGFVVSGRTSTSDRRTIDITSSRTGIKTRKLSISNTNANADIAEAPAAALQLSDKSIDFQNDIVIGGGVRPVLEVKKDNEFDIYLSADGSNPDNYDYVASEGDYFVSLASLLDADDLNTFNRLAALHDTLCVPLSADDAVLMINRNGEETAIVKDAVVAVLNDYYGGISVWPLTKLDDFEFSFALTDYRQTSQFLGSATKHARFNVTLNSSRPYRGCTVSLGSEGGVYSVAVTTQDGEFETEVNSYKEFMAAYGETITLEVSKVPEGRVFDGWRCYADNGAFRRYAGKVLQLPVTSRYNEVYAVFKDESPVVFVDNNYEGEDSYGTEERPFKTISEALEFVRACCADDVVRRGFCIELIQTEEDYGIIEIEPYNGNKPEYITFNLNGSTISGINVSDEVPVIVKNGEIYIEHDQSDAVINLSGERLTLEECYVNAEQVSARGARVDKGELLLVNSWISGFEADMGAGAYISTGATLSLKGMECGFGDNTADMGGGVYLEPGATLNISGNTFFYNNLRETPAPDPNIAGADIYAAGKTGELPAAQINVDGMLPRADVGLGNEACIKVNASDFYIEEMAVNLSRITNPEAVAVKFGIDGLTDEQKASILGFFYVSDVELIAEGYSQHLGLDGRPFITNKKYSTGRFTLYNDDKNTAVDYAYYHGEGSDEYLYLRYNWENGTEYHGIWLVDNVIYRDEIYAKSELTNTGPLPISAFRSNFSEHFGCDWNTLWNNYYTTDRDDDSNPFAVNPDLLSDYIFHEDDNRVLYMDGEDWIVEMARDIAVGVYKHEFFQNMTLLKKMLQPAIGIAGQGLDMDNLSGIEWEPGFTLFGDDVYSDNIVSLSGYEAWYDTESDVFNKERYYLRRTLAECDQIFNKLRNGFDVTISVVREGKVACTDSDGSFEVGGGTMSVTRTYLYGSSVQLTAQGSDFKCWSDGSTDNPHTITIRGDINIRPVNRLARTEFYVSENGSPDGDGSREKPFNSINVMGELLAGGNATDEIVIHVDGEVESKLVLGPDIQVGNITISGSSNASDALRGRRSSVLTVNTSSPVTISNLKITGGRAVNGGGIFISDTNAVVTLADGALVCGNSCLHTDGFYSTGRGGGVFTAGTLFMHGSAVIGDMQTENGATGQNYSNRAWQGAGLYIDPKGKVFLGYSSPEKEEKLTGGICFNYIGSDYFSEGAGVYVDGGFLKMNSGNIAFNGTDGSFGYGAGVSLHFYATFEMSGGAIHHNATAGMGGGVRLGDSEFIMTGGRINNNSAYGGAGVSIDDNSTFRMAGGVIRDNTSEEGIGNGLKFVTGNNFYISDSAYFAPTDDIYLTGNLVITIAGPLDSARVASVNLESYETGWQVLKKAEDAPEGTSLVNEFSKFTLLTEGYAIGYDGNAKQKFSISTPEAYNALFDELSTNSDINTENIYISIEDDLALDGFKPYLQTFKGVFDGNGKTLTIGTIDHDNFVVICWENQGIIQNVKVVKPDGVVCGKQDQYSGGFSGGICHENIDGGIIRNCWSDVSAEVTFVYPIGGICTHNYEGGVIENCLNTGDIIGTFGANPQEWLYGMVGGICGANYGEIKNCVNYGTISMETTWNNSSDLNGIPGAICAALMKKEDTPTASCKNCYWRQNCVVNGSNTDNSNNMVYKDSRVRNGKEVIGCGYFASINNGTLAAGTIETCGSVQTLPKYEGTETNKNLLDALKGYVEGKSYLKGWVSDDNHAAVLKLKSN